MAAKPSNEGAHRRGRGPVALAASVPRLAGPALRRRGFAEAGIATEWPSIVGEALAAETLPQKLVFARGESAGGTLHVRVNGAFATELLHLEPLVIERINGYFGFAAVARLAMSQGPVAGRRRRRRAAPARLDGEQETRLSELLSGIEDDGLRRALEGLGRSILAR